MSADRVPPHDREAEASILGALIVDPACFDDIAAIVEAGDFYFDAHGKVFDAIADLNRDGKPVDIVSVREALRTRGQLADAGGDVALADLLDRVPTAANALYHAGIVRGAAIRRQMIRVGHEIIRDAGDGSEPPEELLAGFEHRLFEIGRGLAGAKSGPVDAKTVLTDALNRIDERQADGGERSRGVPTGFPALDDLLGGLRPGRLVIVAARPSVGKSSLAASFVLAAAAAGCSSLFVSLEMSREELGDRFLSMLSGVDLKRIGGALRLDAAEADALCRVSLGRGGSVWIDDRAGQKVARIASTTRRAIRRHGVRLLVVDYLQLVHPENARDPRHLQVGMVATRLKELARAARIPVVALAQLNREVENRGDGRPRLADLRDSGQIEQDADQVLLLHAKPADRIEAVQEVDVLLEKNRNGPRGVVPLFYRRPNVRFETPSVEFR